MIGNLLTEWSRLLVRSLSDAGIEHAVISPGSRSTPFVAAALACAGLRCESVVDERSAAFVAVGRAKVTGRPSLLICTSGSAAANYFPAIVEASRSRTPLVVLTADRPFELQTCEAPQTIDQIKLYGGAVRHFVDLGLPSAEPSALTALRRMAAQAAAVSLDAPAGPVHLNARARKPLEPTTATSEPERALAQTVDSLLARPIVRAPRAERRPDPAALGGLVEACRRATTGLIVAGPTDPHRSVDPSTVAALVEATGFSFFAEATSQLRFSSSVPEEASVDSLDVLLRDVELGRRLSLDVVITIGSPATSGSLDAFLRREGSHRSRTVVAEDAWPDPIGTADTILFGDLGRSVESLTNALLGDGSASRRVSWLAAANRAAWRAVDRVLEESEGLSEAAAVRTTVEALPRGSLLAVGNSLPVREVDVYCPSGARGVAVWSQRGASGIDGVLSGSTGAAAAWSGPSALLIGDISFLHDVGGLLAARRLARPLAIVVLNNRGGRIFDQLAVARPGAVPDGALEHWTTPHDLHFEHAAALYGLAYARPTTPTALGGALATALSAVRPTVIEVPLDPDGARRDSERLRQLCREELAGLGKDGPG
jgi:2-succinyl-5-enolpyruvyl-6-hydroxy-3-cyclohexene-1-carboxylate synthase